MYERALCFSRSICKRVVVHLHIHKFASCLMFDDCFSHLMLHDGQSLVLEISRAMTEEMLTDHIYYSLHLGTSKNDVEGRNN